MSNGMIASVATFSDVIFDVVQASALFIGATQSQDYLGIDKRNAYLIFGATIVGWIEEIVDLILKAFPRNVGLTCCFGIFTVAAICAEHGMGAAMANSFLTGFCSYDDGCFKEENNEYVTFWSWILALHVVVCVVS
eukprot:877993_1